jgi:hypothetical protein
MKIAGKLQALGALAILGAGMTLTGCKSAPELTAANAQALIQASYDQTAPVGASITVDDLGMRQGIAAKYWTRTKEYPNRFWADFALTDDGKKVAKLPSGGDVIQWRPDNATDTHYSIIVVTTVANHLKAHDINNIQDEVVPGVDTAMGAAYTEGVNLDGVPGPLQDIAHNPGNKLSTKRHADFSLEDGAWKLHSIE